jgi:15-cis-phytoene synthase
VTIPDGSAPDDGRAVYDRFNETVPPGSMRHLAALFSGSLERPLLEALYAFEGELRRIVAAASHEAAHARLQWWRAELDRLAGGRPAHPLARALLPLRGRRDVDLALLHELLVGADLDLARMTYATWRELDAYLFRSAGATQVLIAAVLAGDRGLADAEREFARRLGAATRQSELLFELDRDLARGRLYAPAAALESAGIDPVEFAADARTAAAGAFVGDWQARIHRELEALPGLLIDPAQRTTQRHGLVLAALHAEWLKRRTPRPAAPDRRSTELGAFSRLWIAWRTAVRHG